ncbi:nitrogenase component 1 [Desulforamulus ruminis]|uniref:Oxidoreductase/nitrogenase component 1 n=1 Tax=Desulforamulus ruminis (strain ATCC 23193 / DSM 2154 / NCIMB 8452 / DL) TaxID=696281 RepID=F6DLK9_DESRL|nr:nitrogenase component 1 [Desulforamulus ruminis]AEG61651.1 oxidoreductase/nitrogenase component 1 [Desulforamulus ruminis DSM 2154]
MKKDTASCVNVNENPCNMCMPMGGILPFKGVEQAMVIIHGSQGCATYMRRHMAEHFNEPIDVASSSLNEKGTIYGGEKNLKQGLDNVMRAYRPELIGVLTTCLAETIGEDIDRMAQDYLKERDLADFPVVPVSTPGYGGTHAEGYWVTAKKIVEKLACKSEPQNKINVIIPNISPADIREIKRLLQLMGVEYTLFPDFSDTLDRPYRRPYQKMAPGGTRLADIAAMPGARATIQMGMTVEENVSPGKFLQDQFGVPLYNLPIPMGVESTDLFIHLLSVLTGNSIPESLGMERGRLLDCMIDSHKYNFQGRSVIFGEPENVYAVAKTCMENGVYPVVAASGSKNPKWVELLKELFADSPEPVAILNEADFTAVRNKSRELQANIAIGHSDGRYLTEKEGIPLVRMGFPIHDRTGGQRLLSVGYAGTTQFLDRITNTLLENKHKNYRKSMFEKFYQIPGENEMHGTERGGDQHALLVFPESSH